MPRQPKNFDVCSVPVPRRRACAWGWMGVVAQDCAAGPFGSAYARGQSPLGMSYKGRRLGSRRSAARVGLALALALACGCSAGKVPLHVPPGRRAARRVGGPCLGAAKSKQVSGLQMLLSRAIWHHPYPELMKKVRPGPTPLPFQGRHRDAGPCGQEHSPNVASGSAERHGRTAGCLWLWLWLSGGPSRDFSWRGCGLRDCSRAVGSGGRASRSVKQNPPTLR